MKQQKKRAVNGEAEALSLRRVQSPNAEGDDHNWVVLNKEETFGVSIVVFGHAVVVVVVVEAWRLELTRRSP